MIWWNLFKTCFLGHNYVTQSIILNEMFIYSFILCTWTIVHATQIKFYFYQTSHNFGHDLLGDFVSLFIIGFLLPTWKLYLWRNLNVSELILFLIENVQQMDGLMCLEIKIDLTPTTNIPGAYIEIPYLLGANINMHRAFALCGKISMHVDDKIINLLQSKASYVSTWSCHDECAKHVKIRQHNKKGMRNGNNSIWNKSYNQIII